MVPAANPAGLPPQARLRAARAAEPAGRGRRGASVEYGAVARKKRGGAHERTIREFRLGARGIELGEPLREFQGVLTGVPSYYGDGGPLISADA